MADTVIRTEVPESKDKIDTDPALTQAGIDAAHASTGWNAYEVWRKRVFEPQSDAGHPHGDSVSND